MLRTLIQITALLLALLSSFFLIKGVISLTAEDVAELCWSKWSYNLDLAKNLSQQRSDTIVGFALLLLSFVFQLIYALYPIHSVNKKGVIISIVVIVIILCLATALSNILQSSFYAKVANILKK